MAKTFVTGCHITRILFLLLEIVDAEHDGDGSF